MVTKQTNPTLTRNASIHSQSHSQFQLTIPAHVSPHGVLTPSLTQNGDVRPLLRRRNRLNGGDGVARGEVTKPVIREIPVLPLVEVQGVAEGVVLILGHAFMGAVVAEPADECLPSGAR